MEVVYERAVILQQVTSKEQIGGALRNVCSSQKMLFDILFPLAEIEAGLYNLFEEIEQFGLIGEDAPDADWRIDLQENILTIAISHGPDITEHVQALYN